MLNGQMKTLIRSFSAGSVATVTPDGLPRVSPKATFVILDDQTLAFGNIRSPGTLANLCANPAVEICFTDILHRRALRVTGLAVIVRKGDADTELRAAFDAAWADYVPLRINETPMSRGNANGWDSEPQAVQTVAFSPSQQISRFSTPRWTS